MKCRNPTENNFGNVWTKPNGYKKEENYEKYK